MAEQLQVGINGAPGRALAIEAAQVRVRWYTTPGDAAGALFRDTAGTVLRRFPGPGGDVVVDGTEWLIDLGRLAPEIAGVELLVDFTGHRPAGFVATVGYRTLSHPGSTGEPDQQRLLARLERADAGWNVVAFDQVVLSEQNRQPDQVTHGRVLVLVDSSGSMAPALADGRVAGAVLDAVRGAGRPSVVVRASDGASVTLQRDSAALGREVAQFVEALGARPRRSSSDLVAGLRALGAQRDDDIVVVTDAPPADVAAVQDVLGDLEARFLVVAAPALVETGADRRRWERLTASGKVQRRVAGVG